MVGKELARKNILRIIPYVAGKPIEETKSELKLKEVIKLASNENPLGPSPKAVAAIKDALLSINRYPDSNSFYLKRKIASFLKMPSDNIVLGNGSDELIDIIIKAFVEDDENIIISDTTFLEYEIISGILNRKVKRVALRDFKYDLAAIRKKIDKETKLVFLANPNNPTGTYVNKLELKKFLNGLPENVILILDEAYDTFIDTNDYPHGLDYIDSNNVIVLKTFSKAYGLAGLRVGYAIGDKRFTKNMEKARQPFNVNLLAQKAAVAALGDGTFLQRTRQVVLKGKYYLYQHLREMGIQYVPSVTNFILIDVGRDCMDVFLKMLKQGVIVRDMQQYGLKNFIRVTIGTRAENARFIEALKRVLK